MTFCWGVGLTYSFRQVIGQVMETFDPGAIVLQCGTDSLSGDKLGPFNMSMRGEICSDSIFCA